MQRSFFKSVIVPISLGAVFGIGLMVSQMTNWQKVLAFLDLFGTWDPTLAFVMGGAIAVFAPLYYKITHLQKPLVANEYCLTTNKTIDRKLVIGSVLFGAGWGIAGFCPGPAITAAAALKTDAMVLVVSMVVGFMIAHAIEIAISKRHLAAIQRKVGMAS